MKKVTALILMFLVSMPFIYSAELSERDCFADKNTCLTNCPRTLPYSACVAVCDKMKQACNTSSKITGRTISLTGNAVSGLVISQLPLNTTKNSLAFKSCIEVIKQAKKESRSFSVINKYKTCLDEKLK